MVAFLQSYVVPVVTYLPTQTNANIKRLFGTAFFLGSDGLFVTASHVLKDAFRESEANNSHVGLVIKKAGSADPSSFVARVVRAEAVGNGSDIALGLILSPTETVLVPTAEDADIWQRVATIGYPDEAVSGSLEGPKLNLRGQIGIVQRKLNVGDSMSLPSREAYELDILLAGGMSGAPLFIRRRDLDHVFAVCVGTFSSESSPDEVIEFQEDGGVKSRETRVKINQYGLAERLSPALNLNLTILGRGTASEYLVGKKSHRFDPIGLSSPILKVGL